MSIPWIPILIVAASLGAAVAALAFRERNRRVVLRRVLARRPVGADGVIPGAHSISMPGGVARGALVLHGFGDTPQSVRALCDALARAGWGVEAPLLPGHGRTLMAFDRTTEQQWLVEARAAWLALRSRYGTCVLAGQSMGGALALILAAEDPPAALALSAPFVASTPGFDRAVRWSWLWALWQPYVETADPRSLRDPEALVQSRAYGAATHRSIRALARLKRQAVAALPRVHAPTLMVLSPDDNRVPSAGAESAFAALGSPDKALQWRPGEGHVLLADRGREAVAAATVDWFTRWAGGGRNRGQMAAGTSPSGPVRLTS
jgi:carboxylesterase